MSRDPEIEHILHEGRQAHLAIVSDNGPHVTPELYAWSGGRLWFWFARTTLKARVLASSPRCAAAVTVGERTVLVEGEVDLFDVHRPASLVGAPARGLRASVAAGSYALRNAVDLVAFARDLGTGALGRRVPPGRILAALEPDRVELASVPTAGSGAPGEPVVVALPGPAALPGRWVAEAGELTVDPELLDRAGVGRHTPIAIVSDAYVAPGPAAKVGTLLRGTGRRSGSSGRLTLEADTFTTWDGTDTETHHAAPPRR